MASMFFLSGLSDAQLDRLTDAHIEFAEEYLPLKKKKKKTLLAAIAQLGASGDDSSSAEPNGILLQENVYQRTLDVLGASESSRRDLGEDIQLVKLEYDRIPQPVVAVYLWPDGSQFSSEQYVKIIEEVLLPHVDTDIALHFSGDSSYHAVEDDGLFHIYIFTSPQPDLGLSSSRTDELFACTIPSGSHFYPVAKSENSIVDGDGTIVGEVVDAHNTYSFFDVITLRPKDTSLFRCFIEAIYRRCYLSDGERLRLEEESRAEQNNRKRERYIELCKKRVEAELNKAKGLLSDSEAALESAWAAYQAALMRVRRQEAFVQKLEEDAPVLREKLGSEFDLFSADVKIDRVVPGEGKLTVYTKMLYLRQQQTQKFHELGRMKIEIWLTAKDHPIRVYNLSRIEAGNSNASPHPHIDSNGSLCYGNSEHQFRVLIQQRELYAAAAYAVQYLETSVHSARDFRELTGSEISKLRKQGLLPAER